MIVVFILLDLLICPFNDHVFFNITHNYFLLWLSYLVCCMFKEAASLASSTVHRIHSTPFADAVDDVQMAEMMESAGMVFVQSMKELGRYLNLSFQNTPIQGASSFFKSKDKIPNLLSLSAKNK